jgi:hypothetical protein
MKYGHQWQKILDTSAADHKDETYSADDLLTAEGRSIILLKHPLLYAQSKNN